MFPKCAPTHMLERGGSIMMADAVFLFIRGSWNPGRMSLPCQVPCQAFGPGRCGTAEAEVESIQRGPRCQKDFLAHPFGALKLQISLVAEDMRCWGRRRWDTGVSGSWSIQTLPHCSMPTIHTFQKQKHKMAENTQCTCPWHKTHVVFPYSSNFF